VGVFYPSCSVLVKLRFDELLTVSLEGPPDPQSVAARVGAGQGRTAVDRALDEPRLARLRRQGILPASVDEALAMAASGRHVEPLVVNGGDRNVTYSHAFVPIACAVEDTGYRAASTFRITVPWRDLPIDPRTVRGASVEVHMGTVTPEAFGAGVTRWSQGSRRSVLQVRDSAGVPNRATLQLIGTVDEWTVTHGDRSTVEMHGRDLRGVLIDTKLGADPVQARGVLESLDTGLPLDRMIAQLLSFHPFFEQFAVNVNAVDWPNGVVPPVLANDLLPRHRKNARGNSRGGRPNVPGNPQETTFWDVIVRYCFLAGAIPFFEGTSLTIRPSRTLFDQERAGITSDTRTPFLPDRPRSVGGEEGQPGQPFSIRRLVYGRDIKEVKFGRKFGGHEKPKVIRVVSFDATDSAGTDGRTYRTEARWPPERPAAPTAQAQASATRTTRGARTNRVAPSNRQAQEEIINIPVPGIRDQARCLEIARGLYEEIGRWEMDGSCDTPKLASFGGDNRDPDLIRLRVGDAVEFLTDTRALTAAAPLVSAYTDSQRQPFAQAVQAIDARVHDTNMARVIVATSRGMILELQRSFRVASVRKDWDSERGLAMSFDFQNYYVPRYGYANRVGQPVGATVYTRETPTKAPDAVGIPGPGR